MGVKEAKTLSLDQCVSEYNLELTLGMQPAQSVLLYSLVFKSLITLICRTQLLVHPTRGIYNKSKSIIRQVDYIETQLTY